MCGMIKKRKTSTPRQLLIADFGFYPKQRELKISFQRKTDKITVNRHFLLYLRLKGMKKVLQALFVFFILLNLKDFFLDDCASKRRKFWW